MIGDKSLAAIAASIEYDKRAPNGWKSIGSGGFRRALLGPDGVVYKAPHSPGDSVSQREIENARRLRKQNLWRWDIGIPEVTAWPVRMDGIKTIVNAMPYLPTERKCKCNAYYDSVDGIYYGGCNCRKFGEARTCFAIVYDVLQGLDMGDAAWENNLSFNNGLTWIIDLGE